MQVPQSTEELTTYGEATTVLTDHKLASFPLAGNVARSVESRTRWMRARPRRNEYRARLQPIHNAPRDGTRGALAWSDDGHDREDERDDARDRTRHNDHVAQSCRTRRGRHATALDRLGHTAPLPFAMPNRRTGLAWNSTISRPASAPYHGESSISFTIDPDTAITLSEDIRAVKSLRESVSVKASLRNASVQ